MGNKLREIFGLDVPERLKTIKISSCSPCKKCETYKDYEMVAIYGNIAQRQYATLPDSCPCIDKVLWEMDCFTKLGWYEDNDNILKDNKKS